MHNVQKYIMQVKVNTQYMGLLDGDIPTTRRSITHEKLCINIDYE